VIVSGERLDALHGPFAMSTVDWPLRRGPLHIGAPGDEILDELVVAARGGVMTAYYRCGRGVGRRRRVLDEGISTAGHPAVGHVAMACNSRRRRP